MGVASTRTIADHQLCVPSAVIENPVVVSRVVLRNYKSIAACDVTLGPLTFLVGPNGSGKSNFLDSMRFVSDSLRTSLDHALRDRGTVKAVRRISGGHPNHFAIRLEFRLANESAGHYSFRVGAKPNGGYEVQHEECKLTGGEFGSAESHFAVKGGRVVASSVGPLPATLPDRLMLVALSGQAVFRPVFDALSRIEIYNLNPSQLSSLQRPDPGDLLRRDGSNAASVLQNLPPAARDQINSYLTRLVPGVQSVESKTLGQQETLEFRQAVSGQKHPWHFLASSMSDGTLRALGVLLAIHQQRPHDATYRTATLIGLEEPETALHPAAAGVLLSALREGSRLCQTIVTSHSPDLLDDPDIDERCLYAVESKAGLTRIGQIDAAGREMLKNRLFTPGELLRQNQLAPDESTLAEVQSESQLGLFEFES